MVPRTSYFMTVTDNTGNIIGAWQIDDWATVDQQIKINENAGLNVNVLQGLFTKVYGTSTETASPAPQAA